MRFFRSWSSSCTGKRLLFLYCGGPSELGRVERGELGRVVDEGSHVRPRVFDGNQTVGVVCREEAIPMVVLRQETAVARRRIGGLKRSAGRADLEPSNVWVYFKSRWKWLKKVSKDSQRGEEYSRGGPRRWVVPQPPNRRRKVAEVEMKALA
ncbi:UNVERIFIED_CONTAM: hypothetical protein Sradi_0494300 [Sesamum radiatum]|uniref:Uncharacterized protein n=1 Tax=Sesamum radiatum TaxID=300843 RepID=A0AAW2VHN5_SESRA